MTKAPISLQDLRRRIYRKAKSDKAHRYKIAKSFTPGNRKPSAAWLAVWPHDFNNMITIINGYAEMMTDVLFPSEQWYNSALQIHEAGKRSAVMVRKLLAFAGKQTISPEVMSLNDNVASMLKMLQRLIGENVALVRKPG